MDPEAVWRVIDAQRISLTDLLRTLSDEEWRQPSLCPGWTVRDVTAHLVAQHVSLGSVLVELLRSPGGMNRMILNSARRRARLPTDRLISDVRDLVGRRTHVPLITYREILIDVLVHGQDIAIPLGREHVMPPEAAAVAADRVWALKGPFHARTRFHGFRLTANDTDWSVGTGPDVTAPMAALLLVLTGRLVALPRLTGDGAAALTARLASSARRT